MSNTTKKFALGTIFAAVAGYIAGLLTAPKSGKETREDIKDTADKTVAEAKKDLEKLHTDLEQLIGKVKSEGDALTGKAKDQFDTAVSKATETKDKAQNILGALRKGNTKDQDLKKAIAEATDALDHLKTYLTKS